MTNVEFLQHLFNQLWETYRARVTYVRDYEQVVASTGANFLNDHIAFRSIAWQQPTAGIASISRLSSYTSFPIRRGSFAACSTPQCPLRYPAVRRTCGMACSVG